MADNSNKYVIEIQAEMAKFKKAMAEVRKEQDRQDKINNKNTTKAEKDKLRQEVQSDRREKQRQKLKETHEAKITKVYKDRYKEEDKEFRKAQRIALATQRSTFFRGGVDKNGRREASMNVRGGRAAGRALGTVGRLGAGIVGGALGFMVGGGMAAYGKYQEYGAALGNAIGYGRTSGMQTKGGIGQARGSRLGYSLIDTANHVGAMAKSTGVTGPRELQQAMRATGQDAGEVGGVFGMLRKSGIGFDNASGNGQGVAGKANSPGGKEFQKMISLGMASGLERGRLPEFFQGVTSLVSDAQSRSAGAVNVGDITKQLAMLGRQGGVGFQGERGANIMGKLNAGIVKPGGGEWGESFMRQAMGFGKPGGSTSYYDAEKMREAGAKDPGNIQRMMTEVGAQHGTGQEGALQLRALTGVSLEQAEDLFKIYNSSKSSEEKLKEISDVAAASKSLEEQSLDQMKGIGGAVQRLAGRTDTLIGIGSGIRKEVEWLEDMSTKLLKDLIQLTRTIVEHMGDLVSMIKSWLGKDADEEMKRVISGINTRYQKDNKILDPTKRQDAVNQSYAAQALLDAKRAMKLVDASRNNPVGAASQMFGAEADQAKVEGLQGTAFAQAQSQIYGKMAAKGTPLNRDQERGLKTLLRQATETPAFQDALKGTPVKGSVGQDTGLRTLPDVQKLIDILIKETKGKTISDPVMQDITISTNFYPQMPGVAPTKFTTPGSVPASRGSRMGRKTTAAG